MVFGDDGSPGADVAWSWINDHVWPDWSIDLLSVPEGEHVPRPGEDERLREWTPPEPRPLLERSALSPRRDLTAQGDPRIALASCTDADLVVIGPTGRGAAKRLLHIGSTAEWLVHQPPAPLAVIRAAGRVERVLVAVDGSEPAQRAVTALATLPFATDASIHLLGVYDGWAEPDEGLAAAAAVLAAAGLDSTSEVLRGRATYVIEDRAAALAADLVVIGARGRSGLHRVVAGSTTSALVRSLPGNVLVTA